MSGTTNSLGQTPNLLAGTASLTIDGTQYPVVSDAKHSVSTTSYKFLVGMDGVHGQALDTYMPGYIEATVRDQGTVNTAIFMGMRNSLVVLSLASGKVVTGYGMGCMKAIEVDAKEATFSLRFEGPTVTEA